MAEEDLIFGKNRHYFGGIEPSNMKHFYCNPSYDLSHDLARVEIKGELPDDTVIDGQTLCTVAGCIIRRSTSQYPEDEFSGDFISDFKLNNSSDNPTRTFDIFDADVTLGVTYYYAAFPYTKQGVYNRNSSNRYKLVETKATYFFGYDLDKSDSNPSTRVTYPSDCDNASYTAAVNESTGNFKYNGWAMEPGEKFMPQPCMLTYEGHVYEYLNPDDLTVNVDGETSQVSNQQFYGNAMMEWPKIYTKRWEDSSGVYHFRCSDVALDEDYDCWCNYDQDDHEIEHFYTAIFPSCQINSTYRSIGNTSIQVNENTSTQITKSLANGDGWYIATLADRLLVNDLLVMMFKTTNLQTAMANGRCSTDSKNDNAAWTLTAGMFYGNKSDSTTMVKVFGMMNWWGNTLCRTAGLINDKGTIKYKITRGTHDGSTASDYNLDGSGYLSVDGVTISGSSGGYISEMQTTPFGRLASKSSGSATTYEADGMWFNNLQSNYAYFGGGWGNGSLDGPFCVYLSNTASHASSYIGSSLSYKKLVK